MHDADQCLKRPAWWLPCSRSHATVAAVMAAVLVTTMMQVQLSLADNAARRHPIGLPGCRTRCGVVSVPYPFGIEPHCHLRGFNLTCDTSSSPAQLFAQAQEIIGISLDDSTVTFQPLGKVLEPVTKPPPSPSRNNATGWHLYTRNNVMQWQVVSRALQEADVKRPGDLTCPTDLGAAGCHSSHSTCVATTVLDGGAGGLFTLVYTTGYVCKCDRGYKGNPYLSDGCQDIDECACPKGMVGNPYLRDGCMKSHNPDPGLIIGLGVGSGAILLFLILGAVFTFHKIKTQRKKNQAQRFFKQNHEQLLQQLVCQRADIGERMILSLEEVQKATNNFDKAREVGGGGHGTVYKRILSSLHVVAIKKSKIVIQKEINEFINEVVILSQINHRHIVKLLGCCLETEVPLLASVSLRWKDRLRIAVEIARALVYLHSLATVPIVHRDVKSPNILLDDNLTAKLSDFGASRYVPLDQTGLDTTVQGTFGYLDPMYQSTGNLTEKSDVYSFGVILIELLTRKKPVSYRSPQGRGLVYHFTTLVGEEVIDIALLAAICVKFVSTDRPTMRQVESIYAAKEDAPSDMTDDDSEENYIIQENHPSVGRTNFDAASRE
ncbi:hypothetical protein ACP4OV_003303 [Aristida adscensionis]